MEFLIITSIKVKMPGECRATFLCCADVAGEAMFYHPLKCRECEVTILVAAFEGDSSFTSLGVSNNTPSRFVCSSL